jgi:hypothetical protein
MTVDDFVKVTDAVVYTVRRQIPGVIDVLVYSFLDRDERDDFFRDLVIEITGRPKEVRTLSLFRLRGLVNNGDSGHRLEFDEHQLMTYSPPATKQLMEASNESR